MNNEKLYIRCFLVIVTGILFFQVSPAQTADNLVLYTPYTNISVTPGSSINYNIDVINNGSNIRDEYIAVTNVPGSWNHTLTAGGYDIVKIAVLPGEKKTLKLTVEVPYQVKKGTYTIYVRVGNDDSLPLGIKVASAGSSVSELTCEQKNMEGTSKSSFTFNAVLKNKTATTQQYALMANAPRGWTVAIKPNYKQATSTEVEASSTKNISYDVKPPAMVKAGTYKIPVKAVSGSTSAELEFEVVITGTYDMNLSTPSGLLSAKMTAGDEKKVELAITNTGSADLENVELSAGKPREWQVTFNPQKIDKITPGQTESIIATISADKKAIPGDYVTNIEAKTPETNSSASFRISVRTPMLTGLVGVLLIVLVLFGIFYLFKKYGRR